MTTLSRIHVEVDFEKDGKQQGFLRLPYSVHRSAYGWIGIPIVVIKNGTGPTVLLMAGNHGDEYEGQVTLMKLCRLLEPTMVSGRIIILPAANFPAARAGMRTSPLDEGNLNRSFPGDANGTPTQMIAHFLESELLPQVDYLVDLHSGGSSLMYLPTAFSWRYGDGDKTDQARELLKAFDAPISCIGDFPGEDRTMSAAARRTGVIAMSTELGGSGTVTPEALAVGERGVRRVLKQVGVIPGLEVVWDDRDSRMMKLEGSDYYVYSPDYGLWEPLVDLGTEVTKGQVAAAIHFPETPWREPELAHFERDGLVICKRLPGQVERGDCLFHLAADIDGS